MLDTRNPAGEWERLGSVSEVEPPGSISSRSGEAREVYVFGWLEGVCGVWRSVAGVDVENDAVREVTSLGFDLVSDLAQPLEMPVITMRGRVQVRFRKVER